MAKDYAKKSASKKKSGATSTQQEATTSPPSVWLIICVIIVTAALAYGLYYLSNIPTGSAPTLPEKATSIAAEKKTPPPKTEAAPKNPTSNKYDFYNMLPNSEVTTSPVDAYKPDPTKQKIKYDYMLQTGSFRNLNDAERQKANIGFQGLRAEIKKVSGKNNRIWHRVEVGPFSSRSKMNSAMDKLVAINIRPLAKKLPKKTN